MFAGLYRRRINAVDPTTINYDNLPNQGTTGRPSKGGPNMRSKRYYVKYHLKILQKAKLKRYHAKVLDNLSKFHYNSLLVKEELNKCCEGYVLDSALDEHIIKPYLFPAIELGREDGYLVILREEAQKIFALLKAPSNKEAALKVLNDLAVSHLRRLNSLCSLWSAYLLLHHVENLDEVALLSNEVEKVEKIKNLCIEKHELRYDHLTEPEVESQDNTLGNLEEQEASKKDKEKASKKDKKKALKKDKKKALKRKHQYSSSPDSNDEEEERVEFEQEDEDKDEEEQEDKDKDEEEQEEEEEEEEESLELKQEEGKEGDEEEEEEEEEEEGEQEEEEEEEEEEILELKQEEAKENLAKEPKASNINTGPSHRAEKEDNTSNIDPKFKGESVTEELPDSTKHSSDQEPEYENEQLELIKQYKLESDLNQDSNQKKLKKRRKGQSAKKPITKSERRQNKRAKTKA